MKTIKYPNKSEWIALLKRPAMNVASLESVVSSVLSDVKDNGDAAVKKYTLQFDKVSFDNLLVTEAEFMEAEKNVSSELKAAIQLAKANIEKFHVAKKKNQKLLKPLKELGVGEN